MSRFVRLALPLAGAWMLGPVAMACGAPALSRAAQPETAARGVPRESTPEEGPAAMPRPPEAPAEAPADASVTGEGAGPVPRDRGAPLPYVPGELVNVEVGFDKRVLVVHAQPGTRRVLLYLHGVCGNPVAFEPWARSLVPHATLISLVGDLPCPGGHRHKWSHDMDGLDRRVRAAVDAVEAARGEPLDHDRLGVAGYSQGALRAELLAERFPARYPYVVLMAGPLAPSPESMAPAARVVIMAGEKDKQKHLREAASQMANAGADVRFIELPGARHGEYGPQAEEIMTDMLSWLFRAR